VVERAQRERLLEATMKVVAANGYGPTTVADLTREAGISRTTFYGLFVDKEACFLAAYDEAVEQLMRQVLAASEGEERWPARARAGLEKLLEILAAEPAQARLLLVDVAAAGPAAQRRSRAAVQRLTPLFDEGRDFAPSGRALPANSSRLAAGAVVGLIGDELVAGRTEELPSLLSDLLFATLVAYLGPDAAAREVGEEVR
jgi:AcrR family transcriptional regulator